MNLIGKIRGHLYLASLKLKCISVPHSCGTLKVNGFDHYYEVRGPLDGRPMLLLHGNGGSHRSMETQSLEFALQGYRVYSPDSTGQGNNPPLEEYHYSELAQNMRLFMEKAGIVKPVVLGWSDGGILALMIEMDRPGTFDRIISCGANIHPDCMEDMDSFREWVLKDGSPVTRMMLYEPRIDPSDLSAIKCPTLVCAGSEDLISKEHTELIARSIPGAKLKIFPNATHGSYIKRNPTIGEAVTEFLREDRTNLLKNK